MNVPRTLVFVALGDSLTAGFTPYLTDSDIPYTTYLQDLASTEQSGNPIEQINCTFVNLGVNGDDTRGMIERMVTEVAPREPDYVIVWGGINDLLIGRAPIHVMENLEQMYLMAREQGIEPIACTLTSVTYQGVIVSRIMELNGLISHHCSENRIRRADLSRAMSNESGLLLEEYSSDGLHLNNNGNKRIAETVYSEAIKPILLNIR
jgi:lysophospholipase L1-like esterase